MKDIKTCFNIPPISPNVSELFCVLVHESWIMHVLLIYEKLYNTSEKTLSASKHFKNVSGDSEKENVKKEEKK